MQWHLGDVFDFLALQIPGERTAVSCGERQLSWAQFDRQTNNLASQLLTLSLHRGDKVAVYSRNRVEYMVALVATFKAGLTYVNVNYRYRADELRYLLDYTDAAAVIYESAYANELEALRDTLPTLRLLLEIGDGAPALDGALAFNELAEAGDGVALANERSPDDLLFICTGGTTGYPKAVMWRQHDMFHIVSNRAASGGGVPRDWDDLTRSIDTMGGQCFLLAPPLMHGAGMYLALYTLLYGSELVLLPGGSFDPARFLDIVEQKRINSTLLIGDAMAQPLVHCLDSGPARKLDSLRLIVSSAAPWSIESKRRMLRHLPQALIIDMMGSSEAASFGSSIMTAASLEQAEAPPVAVGEHTRVFTEDLREVVPGSGEVGFVARGGIVPAGYYKEPEKSALAFREIHGVRYSIPGDMCEVNADGTLKFLGRGNLCINSGGEKVYPQEVEAAIMAVDGVVDAVVVGTPDERWGEQVTAVVQMHGDATLNPAAIRKAAAARLADYKVPKVVLAIDDMARGPNGKADYRRLQAYAADILQRSRSEA